MPTAAHVLSDLQPLFRDILDLPDLVLTPSLTAKDVEAWDSFNHVRIISAAEQHFRVRLTAAELDGLKTAGDLAALIATRAGG